MSDGKPKVSIIVPVYNVENYLNYCVDSLLRQTFNDFEILLIDDGSKDNSGKLCDEIKEKDTRISVYHKQNGGLSDARNFGIVHAKGDFLLFIDSDDALHPDFCKVLIELQQKYTADVVSTKMTLFSDYGRISEFNKKNFKPNEKIYYDNEILKQYFNPTDGARCIYHGLCMKLYKRELFNNLRFEKGRLHEDLYITHKLLNISSCFVFVDLPYYYYYQKNMNSICKNYKPKNFNDEIDAIHLMISSYENNADIYPSLKRFVADHYMYLINRYYGYLKGDKELRKKQEELKKWVMNYLKTENGLSFKYKLKKYIRLRVPHIYAWYSIKSERIDGVEV